MESHGKAHHPFLTKNSTASMVLRTSSFSWMLCRWVWTVRGDRHSRSAASRMSPQSQIAFITIRSAPVSVSSKPISGSSASANNSYPPYGLAAATNTRTAHVGAIKTHTRARTGADISGRIPLAFPCVSHRSAGFSFTVAPNLDMLLEIKKEPDTITVPGSSSLQEVEKPTSGSCSRGGPLHPSERSFRGRCPPRPRRGRLHSRGSQP